MPRKPSSQPTDVELTILRVFWKRGPSTVGDIHKALKPDRDTSYSTTVKMIQVMHAKGLLIRDESTWLIGTDLSARSTKRSWR